MPMDMPPPPNMDGVGTHYYVYDGLNSTLETLSKEKDKQTLPRLPNHGQRQKKKAAALKEALNTVSRNNLKQMKRTPLYFRANRPNILTFDSLLCLMMDKNKSFRHDPASLYVMNSEVTRENTFSINWPWKKWPECYDSLVQCILSTVSLNLLRSRHRDLNSRIILSRQVGHQIISCIFSGWAKLRPFLRVWGVVYP